MVQGLNEKQTSFDGHYTFSVIPSMARSHWIIDSGASCHVCYDADMLITKYRLKEPVSVNMPGLAKMFNLKMCCWFQSLHIICSLWHNSYRI